MYTHIHIEFYDRLLGPLKHAYIELRMFMLRACMHAYVCMFFTVFVSSLINCLNDCCMHGLNCICLCRALWPLVWMIVACICWIAYIWARWSISCTIVACISLMYVCMHMYVYICLCSVLWSIVWTIAACIAELRIIALRACIHAYVHICTHKHMSTHMHAYANICALMHTYSHMCKT